MVPDRYTLRFCGGEEEMAAATSLAASSAFSSICSRSSSERHECVRGSFTSSPSEAKFVKCAGWENPQRIIRGRLNPLWRRLSSPAMALDAGKDTSAASGVDGQQWPIPRTIEEAIEQVTDTSFGSNTVAIVSKIFRIRLSRFFQDVHIDSLTRRNWGGFNKRLVVQCNEH